MDQRTPDMVPSAAPGSVRAATPSTYRGTRWTGADIPRIDADKYVSGRIDYAADLVAPGTLHVSVLRSPHAHARVRAVDAAAAAGASGVVAVLTGEDIRACSRPMPTRLPQERFPAPIELWCLAPEEVLYVGQPVAAVVSASRNDAEAARQLIRVEYEVLKPVLDAGRAACPDAPRTRSEWATNVVMQDHIRQGNAAAAFAAAPCVVRGVMSFGAATSAPMEPRCYLAEWDARAERLTVRGSLQQPHPTRMMLSQALGLSEPQIRVVASTMGGTFGLKMVGHPEELLVCIAARLLKRPVAFIESREECFLANAREQVHEFEVAAAADGRLLAFRDTVLVDVGTIGGGAGWLMGTVTPTVFPTVYDVRDVEVTARLVTTNKPPWQGVRGYGKETGNLVMERAVDLVAARLGLDPVDVRRRNLLPSTAFPHRLPSGLNLDSGDYEGALDQLLGLVPLDTWRAHKAAADPRDARVGIGWAFDLTPEGASFPGSTPSGFETSTVTVDPSGSVRVSTSVTSPGSGNETGIAQLVADVFGLAPGDITVSQGDTDITPFGSGNSSSRSLMFGGAAAVLAARDLRNRIAACAATLLEADPGELDFADGSIGSAGGGGERVGFRKAVATIYAYGYSTALDVELPLTVSRTYRAKNVRHVPDEFGRISAYPSFPYSVHAALVELDAGTAQVRVLDYAAVHDCGVVVNPGLVEGQFKGAIAMGIGAALWEELLRNEAGVLRTARFKSYVLPRSMDLPRFRVGHRCTPSPFHPLGSKGAGESGFGGAMAVMANAVADALGERGAELERIPCRPDYLSRLLAKAPR